MRLRRARTITIILLGIAGLTLAAIGYVAQVVRAADDAKPAETAPPPLVVDKENPLLLEKPAEPAPETASQPRADNSACLVCHENYTKEFLAGHHSLQNMGCVKCHGESLAHRNDENNTTPPDTMYSRETVDAMCGQCHHSHNVPPAKVVERWFKRNEGGPVPETIVCTDCHGRHRLEVRTVRWDKRTGKLLPKEEEKEGQGNRE